MQLERLQAPLEDSDQGMIGKNKKPAGALRSLDVLLDLHISFSVWLAAELCCKVQVFPASAAACIWGGELGSRGSAGPVGG